jgi:hypothetical protein
VSVWLKPQKDISVVLVGLPLECHFLAFGNCFLSGFVSLMAALLCLFVLLLIVDIVPLARTW